MNAILLYLTILLMLFQVFFALVSSRISAKPIWFILSLSFGCLGLILNLVGLMIEVGWLPI